MTHRYYTLSFIFLAVAIVLAGCDQSSLNNAPDSANEYIITQNNSAAGDAVSGSFRGSTPNENPTVTVPDTVDYYVEGYTQDKSYTWTVNDQEVPVAESSDDSYVWEKREGEFVTLYFTADDELVEVDPSGTTTNTLSVDSPDDDINAETLEISTVTPSVGAQVSRLPHFSTLASVAGGAGLATDFDEGGPFTVLAPRDSAFTQSINALPTQATDADEDSSSSVAGQILQYHTIEGEIGSDGLSDGQTATTLLGDLEVEFGVSGDEVTVNDRATVVRPDIPSTNGVLHRLDSVLLPPTALVDFTDRSLADTSTTASDTLVVDGSYFPEGGGFIVLHDQEELQNAGAVASTVGVSDYIEPGIHNEVKIPLDEAVSDTTTIGAMPHQDTNGNETYDFATSGGTEDGPYTLEGSAVLDFADINVFDPSN